MKKLFILAVGLLTISAANAATIPTQKFDKSLHDMLPSDIQKQGSMISVTNGSFPPYTIVVDNKHIKGAAIDFDKAIGQLLGIKIEHRDVSGLSSILMGIKSGRYQYANGPIGDFANREKSVDFVDYVQEHVVFAVQKGNPKHIDGLATTCGKRISVMAGGSAERVIRHQSQLCQKDGKAAIKVLSYNDQPTSILAVKSNRADAFFSSGAPLSYFVQMSHGQLELAGMGKSNGFGALYQGAVVPKNSKLGATLKACYEKLHANGTYDAIMNKWHLSANKLAKPALNLAATK